MPSHSDSTTAGDTRLSLLVKGALIGVANLIPGVSGGTFALILGVFDRMIAALHHIGGSVFAALLLLFKRRFSGRARLRFQREWRRADLGFLAWIGAGALVAIALLTPLLKWLLEAHPGITLAFFLGLIIPSLAIPWGMMARRGWRELVWAAPGVAATVGIAFAFTSDTPSSTAVDLATLGIALASGAVGVSAMVLPGISGSFVLLVIGQYGVVLHHLVNARSLDPGAFLWLGAFAVGCLLGLFTFARLLHWFMARWRSATLAFLVGLVLGSFWIMWPFKNYDAGEQVEGRSGQVKRDIQIATAPQRLPRSWGEVGASALGLAAGLGGAFGVDALGRKGRAAEGDRRRETEGMAAEVD